MVVHTELIDMPRYAQRRTEKQIERDTKKVHGLLEEGCQSSEIETMMNLTFAQVHDAMKKYPDRLIYSILKQNTRASQRITLIQINRMRNLLQILPTKTVANIEGYSWERISKLGRKYQSGKHHVNIQLFGQIAEWLVGRFLAHSKPNQKWHILECIDDSRFAPDFWTDQEWWEVKTVHATNVEHKRYRKTFEAYLNYIPTGNVVYWFGYTQQIRPDPRIRLLTSKDLIQDSLPTQLKDDIMAFNRGEFLNLARRWYGFT